MSVELAWKSAAKSNEKIVNKKFETLFLSGGTLSQKSYRVNEQIFSRSVMTTSKLFISIWKCSFFLIKHDVQIFKDHLSFSNP